MELLLENQYIKIFHLPDDEMIYVELLGSIPHEDYKVCFMAMIDKGVEKGIKRLLVNQATMEKSGIDSKAWLITTWLPKAYKTFGDNIKVAIFLSKNLFTKIGGEYVIKMVRALTKMNINSFTDMDEAKKWLLT